MPAEVSNQPSLIQTSEEEILLCGGRNNEQKCLELKDNQWHFHSNLKTFRYYASAVSMPGGIFIFGGNSATTWEWLPSRTNLWQSGSTNIPGYGLFIGCAVKINDNEILLIGGKYAYKRVLKFNTNTKEFTNLGDVLKQERWYHACIVFEDKIIITGGLISGIKGSSTEIINLNDLTTAHTAGNMVERRYLHGLVVVHVDNMPSVLAVGGEYFENDYKHLDSIEMWHPTNETWTMTSMTLSQPRLRFGFISLPTRLVCPSFTTTTTPQSTMQTTLSTITTRTSTTTSTTSFANSTTSDTSTSMSTLNTSNTHSTFTSSIPAATATQVAVSPQSTMQTNWTKI